MKRVVALVPNVLEVAPGQRARIELWAPHLERAGWDVEFRSFEDDRLHEVLYEPGHSAAKAVRLLQAYGRHLQSTLRGLTADVLFVYREAALVGPAITERLAARHAPRMIYDLDDPTFVPYRSPVNGWLSLFKFPGKTRSLFRLSDHVITINRPIAEYARRFNPSVSVVPNLVDTNRYRPALSRSGGPVRLVWIGSHTTIPNLYTIAEPLRRLQRTTPVVLRVIADRPVAIDGVEIENRPWSSATEVDDVAECDIGIVPLNELPWNRWKFFFKTLQYMAVGLPVVARPLGSNPEVLRHGVDGFLADSPDEWYDRLLTLIRDPAMRQEMGAAARDTVVNSYSVNARMQDVVGIFDGVAARSGVQPISSASSV